MKKLADISAALLFGLGFALALISTASLAGLALAHWLK